MARWFNISGPCQPDIHYMLSPTMRLPNLSRLIEQRSYFVIHAPRQTGKTTAMLALAKQLTQSGRYTALMVSAEVGAPFSHDPATAEIPILDSWKAIAQFDLPEDLRPPDNWIQAQPGRRIQGALQVWAQASERPLVLFIDEIDSLQDEALISILRQLRDGYRGRPTTFPTSVGLIGLRDVRDYKVASGSSTRLKTASPFNIKDRSLTMRDFNALEVGQLYQQHTEDTGQVFTQEAVQTAYDLTQGQPWLVNALAKEIVEELVTDTSVEITAEHINQAKEILIARQDTHLDSLAEKLTEPRVKAIIEPMLAGIALGDTPNDDRQYLVDLGLLRRDPNAGLTIANPIYREVIPRVLTQGTQDSLPSISPTWLTPEGELNVDALLQAFIEFWRQHGEPLLGTTSFHEIAPHIVLMAFLHRVVNGGGTLEREYAIGRDRMDLCLRYRNVTLGIELKAWREKKKDPESEGLDQLDSYLKRIKVDYGWLFVFDRRKDAPSFAERLKTKTATTKQGRSVVIIRA
ncbi:polyketide biosynthesis operon protein CyrO [Scytonema hofmannii PCC 7110]|uniref:Polyketide biosynthesis operon protein CyrO n=1 Tax=Scytonema hofmannii PCC 7110 TaxID=128403 RepID=A0A139XC56_9CYAN|nr:ATP-binding protein [Scytonema hofmannii]KYC42233.1 polyketide biosynthesis operon protein CyrO [Scytonema hofmannii PCC 7110]